MYKEGDAPKAGVTRWGACWSGGRPAVGLGFLSGIFEGILLSRIGWELVPNGAPASDVLSRAD